MNMVMNRKTRSTISFLAVMLVVSASGMKAAESPKAPEAAPPVPLEERAGTWMVYRLDGGLSRYRYVEIVLNGEGKGSVTCAIYGDKDTINQSATIPIALSGDKIDRFITLFNKINFFTFKVRNRNKNRLSATDTGTTTLTFRTGGKTRTISYGYVKNDTLKELTELFWNVARPHLPRLQNE